MSSGKVLSPARSRFRSEEVGICLETLLEDPRRCDRTDLDRIVRAASSAGFRSAGLWSDRAVELGVGTVRAILDDSGVRTRMVEVRTHWARGPEAAVEGIDERLDMVSHLGAEMMLAVSQYTSMELPVAVEGFAALCERAAGRGLKVTIEFLPCRALCDLATAWAVVGGSGAANGGIDIDLMHWQYQSAGPDLDRLRTIPPEHVHFVQVCDASGPAPAPEDYVATAIRARHLPGEGEVDITSVLFVLEEMGADPFLAMEVFNSDLVAGGPAAMAQRVRAAADGLWS